MRGKPRALGARLSALLRLDDPPWRIALALAVGVFISCTPLYGLQTLLSLVVATGCRLNKAATVTGAWLNLPWFAPFVYGAALWVGGRLVPGESARDAAEVAGLLAASWRVSWREAVALLRGLSLALVVGTTLVGAVAGAVTWVIAYGVIRRRRSMMSP
ncbi:MAG: DUF2062 domain-containing protein [Candidatus Rokubacteria bacterium]|nr:DUF2062 domain-containing protein [Candidatus Rokubacteria bacterium]